ncbi:hypothetical protein [Clostridium sp. UBA4395]|uniref:hypothetical protein n=1 Tax=Clostridium sp. UBA4395 TaxID=1946360 RepID=UPI003217ABD7
MEGWIKLHRCLMKKAIWTSSSPEQKVILITLLMMANHEGREWQWQGKQFKANPGEFVTSAKSIMTKAGEGISRQNVRTALEKFTKYEFLTYVSTKTGILVSIVNWRDYQAKELPPNQPTNHDLTNRSPTPNQQVTTNKNDKNIKNIYSDFEKEIISLYPGKKIKAVREKKLPKLLKEYGEEQIKRCVERYAKECKDKKTDKQFILNESTFWNGRYKDYLDPAEEEKPKKKPKLNFVYRDL